MKRRGVHALWPAILLAVTNQTASAHDTAESLRACANETDDSRRLECYDREMARHAASMDNAQPKNAAAAAAPTPTAEERFGLNDEQARKQQGIEQPPQLERLTATITKISRRPQGELVMTLGNGQVWAQKQALSFEVKVGDTITIKTAALGSFLMSTASGRSTRVTRVL